MIKNSIIKLTALTIALIAITVALPALAQKKTKAAPKITSLKRVNVSEEKVFEHKELVVTLPPAKSLPQVNYKNQKSIPLEKIPADLKLLPVDKTPKMITKEKNISAVPIVKALDLNTDLTFREPELKQKNLVELNKDEHKMIQAMIFIEYHKRYDLAMPLFVELMDSPDFKHQATYHYAEAALLEKLYSEFREKMLKVSHESKDPIIKRMAIEALVKNMQYLPVADLEEIEPMVKALDVDTTGHPTYLIKKAKFYSEKGNLSEVESALLLIPSDAPEYIEGTLLKAIFNYRRGEPDAAITELEVLWPRVEEDRKDRIRNMTALTLARLYFQKGDYKTAYKYFVFVDKTSGQWLQSMIEQAWTQILANDNEGAAGNMFTLHSEYFKKTFAPESYVIRTVGYLNMCQYGDGVSVLDDLNRKYNSVYKKLDAFQKNSKSTLNYYDLVKTFLTGSKQEEYQGVPRAFALELAHHPSYMNVQEQINLYEDELAQFNKLTLDIIKKESSTRLEMIKAKNDHAAALRDPKKADSVATLEMKFLAKEIENQIYSRARTGIKKMREAAVVRLNKEENVLRLKAAKNLQARFSTLKESLQGLLGQQEILSYEIYSGAGEHIRYQMAGGDTKAKNKDKKPAGLTGDEKNNYSWKFKGEMWDDEIGHYRSSLKNVCPEENKE